MATEFKFEITEQIGVLSSSPSGWSREVNMVSWNGRDAKLDIRDWAPENAKVGKGVSLTREESKALKEILNQMEDL